MPLEDSKSAEMNATSRTGLIAAAVALMLGVFAAIFLRRRLRAETPDFADNQPHDPGSTLVSLFGFLGESLAKFVGFISRRARRFLALLTSTFERK